MTGSSAFTQAARAGSQCRSVGRLSRSVGLSVGSGRNCPQGSSDPFAITGLIGTTPEWGSTQSSLANIRNGRLPRHCALNVVALDSAAASCSLLAPWHAISDFAGNGDDK